jgi:tetratricopeptide (TPR) repeat protein
MSKRNHGSEVEIDGYLELGLVNEALKLAREIISRAKITAIGFNSALSAILQAPRVKQWRQIVETSYNRLSRKDQGATRSNMLAFYLSIDDSDSAARHFPSLKTANHGDLFLMMSTLLDLDRLDEARGVARQCERVLEECQTPFEQSSLIEALARYHARIGEWNTALELWEHAPLDQPFNQDALTRIVEIHSHTGLGPCEERSRSRQAA